VMMRTYPAGCPSVPAATQEGPSCGVTRRARRHPAHTLARLRAHADDDQPARGHVEITLGDVYQCTNHWRDRLWTFLHLPLRPWKGRRRGGSPHRVARSAVIEALVRWTSPIFGASPNAENSADQEDDERERYEPEEEGDGDAVDARSVLPGRGR